MNENDLRNLCLSLSGATENIQWGNDLVFKVAGKMFACAGLDEAAEGGFSFKCTEESFYELTALPGITPAPHLAKAHWVLVQPTQCRLKPKQIEELICESYKLVVLKLPKKAQMELSFPNSELKPKKKKKGK